MPNQIARRSQQQRRSETEQRVLAAAMALIAERGSRGVSLAEVGRLAGYSSGIVSHHFGGKQQLLAAVVKPLSSSTTRSPVPAGLTSSARSSRPT